MRPHVRTATSALLFLPALASAVTFDCTHLRVDGQSFNLKALGGPRSVSLIEDTPPSLTNTTFTVDICNPLERTKGVPKDDECPSGTRVCGIEYDYNLADNSSTIRKVIPIAGEYTSSHSRPLDPFLTRLKDSASHEDSKKEGVRVELNGGRYPLDKSSGQVQKAIIEFVCDPERTGLEGAGADEREKEEDESTEKRRLARDDDEENTPKNDASLQFVSYRLEGDAKNEIEVLRLNWRTKYACEGVTDIDPSPSKSNSWGFFTWFLIIAFMLTATYLIFGSWLNYNRYGARGWDLLPHGDTIRDLPYTVKDWGKTVVNKVQGGGGGSRGGYSAV